MEEKYIRFAADKLTRAGFADIQYVSDDEQGADILATAKSGAHVCIKCVYTDKPVTANAVNEAYQAKKAYGCNAAMVITNSTFTEKAEEFAGKAKVSLKAGVEMAVQRTTIEKAPLKPAAAQNTQVCPLCRSSIDKKAKICPVCGKKVKKPLYKRGWFVVLMVLLVVAAIGNSMGGSETTSTKSSEGAADNVFSGDVSSKGSSDVTEVLPQEIDLSNYAAVTSRNLYSYAEYMIGENVVTLVNVSDVSGKELKVKFADNDTFYFNFVFVFDDRDALKGIRESDTVAVSGNIKSVSMNGSVTVSDCAIVGIGGMPEDSKMKNPIGDSSVVVSEYKKLAEEKAAIEKAAQEEKAAQAKAEYIASCETLVYSDVSRNPEQFKGKATKVSGTVIQVQEMTLLGTTSVVLRVDAGNDNIWYITYTRPEGESRILEDDWITCYGECEGVESYTTVLGSQITIPSMKMKYYE